MKTNGFFVTLFLISVIHLSCDDDNKSKCFEYVAQVNKLIEKSANVNDTMMVITRIDEILKRQPTCVELFFKKGDLLIGLNKLEESKEAFYATLNLDTVAIYPLYKIGMVYQELNKFDSSVYYFTKALSGKVQDGGVVDFYKLDGVDERNSIGRYDIGYLELTYQLARSKYYMHDLKTSLDHFNICIMKGYMYASSLLYRGSIYLEFGKKSEACSDFTIAKQQGMQHADIYLKQYCH